MKIAVVIPTYKRIKKLERCLKSLESQTYKDFWINVYADNNDSKTFNYINDSWTNKKTLDVIPTEMAKQSFVIGCWNDFFYSSIKMPGVKGFRSYDAVAWIVDDVELYPNYLEELVKAMQTNFPDLDGVVGAKQVCPDRNDYTFKYYGQVLLGKKFIERYKEVDYKVCCPAYKHFFQDEEMWIYANSLGKFVNCETAILNHYHPAFVPEELDETHNLIRDEVKKTDQIVHEIRTKKNLIWGKTWQEK